MKIYTSYFGNIKKLKENNIIPISICAYPPSWFEGPNIKLLAPPKDLLIAIKNNKIDEIEYREKYISHIYKLINSNKSLISELIYNCSQGQDIALCCFETPDKFCHRHILEYILNKEYGWDIKEFGKETSNKLF